jgi:glycosyltransferase involved in cell wall biosynthesis
MKHQFTSSDLSSFRPSISHHVNDPPKLRRPWTLPPASREYRRLAAELRPDLVHGLYLTGYGWIAESLGIRPLVLSALGSDVLVDLNPDRKTLGLLDQLTAWHVARRTRRAVASADLVFTDSVSLAAKVEELFPGTEIRIVRFGIETGKTVSDARPRWRGRLDVDEDAFVILSSRLMRPRYNIDTIVRALPAIRDRCPSAVLVLKELPRFSDVEYREACLKLADSLGVREAIRLVGELERDDLLELQAAADVYVSIPSTDGTAVSVLEAMAAGVAVVASDAPGIDPTILIDGESAVLVPVGDADALASAVADLAADPTRHHRLVERAREIVRYSADLDRELDRAVLLYEELLAATGVSASSGDVYRRA